MKVGILGSGVVGRTLSARLVELGHEVTLGTRDVAELMARSEPDPRGNPSFAKWKSDHPDVGVETFAGASASADMVVNATAGAASLEALAQAEAGNLTGKVLIDVSNPLDFSHGIPPSLTVSNTDSLGEQIQRTYPETKVVKTLNTVNAHVMVDPGAVADGDHHVFVSGDDASAKDEVASLLRSFGWHNIVDLGGIVTARSVEMYLPLWVALMLGPMGGPMFNIKLVSA